MSTTRSIYFASELHQAKEYGLPDGRVVIIGNETFRPSMIGSEQDGIHQVTSTSIRTCDIDIGMHLYGNVLAAGKGTMFLGFGGNIVV